MNIQDLRELEELESIPTITRHIGIILVLSGLLLITVSFLIPGLGPWHSLLRELTKELGIVLLAVFGVSLLYELILAKRYIRTFLHLLGREVMKGESNAAMCAYLGIRKIFPNREDFEKEFSLVDRLNQLQHGDGLRIVARSLLMFMGRADKVQEALSRGAHVELCLLSPQIAVKRAPLLSELQVSDIYGAISMFEQKLASFVAASGKVPGKLELRFHDVDLFDSWFVLQSGMQQVGIWDLSFGWHVSAKRVFVLDLNSPLGTDLNKRYGLVYGRAEVIFQYDGEKIVVNKLDQFLNRAASSA